MTPCDCRRGCCLLNAFVHFTAVLINAQQTGDGKRDWQWKWEWERAWKSVIGGEGVRIGWTNIGHLPRGCCVKCQNLFANQSQTYTRTQLPQFQSQCLVVLFIRQRNCCIYSP